MFSLFCFLKDIAAFERLLSDDISCGKTPLLVVSHAGKIQILSIIIMYSTPLQKQLDIDLNLQHSTTTVQHITSRHNLSNKLSKLCIQYTKEHNSCLILIIFFSACLSILIFKIFTKVLHLLDIQTICKDCVNYQPRMDFGYM